MIAAVSGGADSAALLDILLNLPGFRLTLVVAHLNHALRGAESDEDEAFVRRLAEKFQLPFETRRIDVAGLAADRRVTLEEAGREARYNFFSQVAEKYDSGVIATAHHKDDQAETVLMRLLRGAAASGLVGIRARSPDKKVVRPLLCASRREIEVYLLKKGLLWREDSSNSDTGFLRNRIRHQLLPLLLDYNPEVVERLNSTAKALAADESLLGTLTADAFTRCKVAAGPGVTLDLDRLLREPDALHLRIYRQAVLAAKGDLRRISSSHLEAIERLVSGDAPNTHLDLPDNISVARTYNSLTFSPDHPSERLDSFELRICACGIYQLPCGRILHVESVALLPGEFLQAGKDTVFLDPARIPFPWQVRYFKPGDRFTPLGMSGHKKLKDLFIDRKIPLIERYRTPLLLQGADVVWVCGRQLSEKGRLAGREETVIRVRLAYTVA